MDYKFRVEFLEDAKDSLDGLDDKTKEKILYNIWKARFVNDNELFKKLQDEIWEFRTKIQQNTLSSICILGQDRQRKHSRDFNSRTDKKN
jgi:uncharacterized protein (TIGR01639 family)